MAFDRFFDAETMEYMYIETYDPSYTYFYIYDSEGGTCYGETVFASDGAIEGITISDPWTLCPTVGTYDWTYTDVTLKEDGTIASFTGP